MPRSFRTFTAIVTLVVACMFMHQVCAVARADDDPFSEILQSKDLLDRNGLKRAKRSKLKYVMGPWFEKGTNFEKLFKDPQMATHIIEWVAPIGKQFLISDADEDHEETHVRAQAIVQERATRAAFGLTVLVPHPAFLAVVEGKLIDDFAQRLPPLLPVDSSEQLRVQGFEATAYALKNDRCTLVITVAHKTLVELRSVEECGGLKTIKALAESLNLIKLDQKLQS